MNREAQWLVRRSNVNFYDDDDVYISSRRSSSLTNANYGQKRPEKSNQIQIGFHDFDSKPIEHEFEPDEENKRLSYCYLCSIKAHEHKKTEPVPIHKRRYLKTYLNPLQVIKKFEKNQHDLEIKTKYRILVKTGSGAHAATNSTVWFKLYGSAGIWEQTELTNKNNTSVKFPSDSLVEINLDGPVIGDLKKLKIWAYLKHNGKSIKDGWYLEFVEITCFKLTQTWRFVCDQWLSIHRPPNFSNSTVLTLNSNLFDNDKTRNATEYLFMIKTSNKPLIGNDITCQFQFSCSKFPARVFNLVTPYVALFDKNQLDCFLVMCSHDLGHPEKIKLAHNSRKMPHDWSIEYIKVIYSREPSKLYMFKLDKWLDKNDKMNAIINYNTTMPINPSQGSGKMIYYISVITGNSRLSGTDARVFIELKGTKGVTSPQRLHNPETKREFERGKMDHFQIYDVDIGQIKRIRIWHDNSGNAPGWQLDAVLVRSISTALTGKEENHDADLNNQLDRLRKKFKIKEMKLEEVNPGNTKTQTQARRSKSAEISRTNKMAKNKIFSNKNRSKSADQHKKPVTYKEGSQSDLEKSASLTTDSVNYKNILIKNLEKKSGITNSPRQMSSPSILKTSASPRSASELRKHVKFDSSLNTETKIEAKGNKQDPNKEKSEKSAQNKIEMNLHWILSINYNDASSNLMKSIKTIENYDKTIKNIDKKLLEMYDAKTSKLTKPVNEKDKSEIKGLDTDSADNSENLIYVFECKKWLAKDMGDKKIERILELSNILRSK